MRLGYVKSAFRNVAAGDKHENIKVIELGENSMCRVLLITPGFLALVLYSMMMFG